MGWFNSTTNFFFLVQDDYFRWCFFFWGGGFAYTTWKGSMAQLPCRSWFINRPVSKSPPFGGVETANLLFQMVFCTKKTAFPESSDSIGRPSHCLHLFLGFVPGLLLLGTMPLLLVFMLYLWPGIVEDQDHGLV